MAWLTAETAGYAICTDVLIDLTDDTGTGNIDDDVLDYNIDQAVGEVKAFLAVRYPTECEAETADPLIEGICMALLVRNLYNRRPGAGMPMDWANRLARGYDLLEAIRDGSAEPSAWGATTETIGMGKQTFTTIQTIPELEAGMEIVDL